MLGSRRTLVGVTISFGDVTVTTWGERDGGQQWRARSGEKVAHFLAGRTAPAEELYRLALEAIAVA